MPARVTRPKVALYAGWISGAVGLVLAGGAPLVAGFVVVAAGLLLFLAARWGIVAQYSGRRGRPSLPGKQVHVLSVLCYAIAAVWVLLGVSLIARAL
jgi:hypothetical protein